jgi:hypothetical protein
MLYNKWIKIQNDDRDDGNESREVIEGNAIAIA